MDFLAIFRIFGTGLLLLAVLLLAPLAVVLASGGVPGPFLFSAILTALAGAGFLIIGRGSAAAGADIREAMLAVVLWWCGAPVFAGLPFFLGGMPAIDAYTEAVSALTTTGAWISDSGARASFAGALWRALLQWFGGLVSLAVAAAIFIRPLFLGIETEQAPFSRGERESYSRAFANALKAFSGVYGAVTLAALISFLFARVPSADAVIFALSIPASGGFSWAAEGFGAHAPLIAGVALPFIFLSGANFILIASVAAGRRQKLKDRETGAYALAVLGIGVLFWVLINVGGVPALPAQVFNAASLLSTNGYMVGETPPFAVVLVTVVIGGSAVSTAGGIKILRWLFIFGRARDEVRRLIAPSGVFTTARGADALGVWIHFLVFTFVLGVLTLAATAAGHDFSYSTSAAVGALANAGPVIGLEAAAGPTGLEPVTAPLLKLVLAGGMILGRIEAVAALALFNRAFWRS